MDPFFFFININILILLHFTKNAKLTLNEFFIAKNSMTYPWLGDMDWGESGVMVDTSLPTM